MIPSKIFCCLNSDQPASFEVYPKDGIWTLAAQYEVMLECEKVQCLQGVAPCRISQGGFAFPRKISDAMYDREKQFLGYRESCEIRTYGVRSAHISESAEDWKEKFPLREDFHTPMGLECERGGNRDDPFSPVNTIELRAKAFPTLEMMVALCKIFIKLGHFVQETRCFEFEIDYESEKLVCVVPKHKKLIPFHGQLRIAPKDIKRLRKARHELALVMKNLNDTAKHAINYAS